MGSTRLVTASCLLVIVLGAPTAYADGECAKGSRDTTAAERQTMTNALEVVKAALPAAPDGWIIGGYEVITVPSSICMDVEATPWPYNLTRIYNRADDAAEREQALADAGAALRASMAERQPRIDALMAKSQELGAELGAAAQKGDQARIDAINRELAQLQKETESIFNEGPSAAQLAAISAIAMQDREITISIAVNPAAVSNDDMQSTAAPAGAQAAFRAQTTTEGVTRARVLVLLGGWQPRAEGGMQSVGRGNESSAAAHAMSVHVTADPARLDAMLAAIDFGAVAALLH
jgi:hypothetical protein